jgi:hypothetical protein
MAGSVERQLLHFSKAADTLKIRGQKWRALSNQNPAANIPQLDYASSNERKRNLNSDFCRRLYADCFKAQQLFQKKFLRRL